ncbi:MAG TPA: VWA domain-containing protein [Steroidobacteraceae bacterium]|nr:VWA domain-containing protein [Steroidobacteraceae bacterium]
MPRRKFDVFSMSFLDAICCGFGSVVLIFMLITAQGNSHVKKVTDDRRSEALLVEQQLLDERKNLAEIKNSLEVLDKSKVTTQGLSERVLAELDAAKQELAESEAETLARRARLEKLKADIASLEEGAKRLEDQTKKPGGGAAVRGFKGTGDRLYLTGMRVGGQHVLILVDASASMLDETLVNILRMRNMSDDKKLRSEKWRQAVTIADWISTQIPTTAQFQMYTFNTRAEPLVEGSAGQWLKLDGATLEKALNRLRKVVPKDGTSLENAFAVAKQMNPQPDNLILITDGLPTQGKDPPTKKLVDGDDRLRLFERAIAALPKKLPVNTILLPMEGDPQAPYMFWSLAKSTQGSFMAPSRDWP